MLQKYFGSRLQKQIGTCSKSISAKLEMHTLLIHVMIEIQIMKDWEEINSLWGLYVTKKIGQLQTYLRGSVFSVTLIRWWFGFVNNNPTSAQKLVLIMFGADGYDGNGLQLETIGQFFQVLPVYFREVAKNLLWLFFVEEKP